MSYFHPLSLLRCPLPHVCSSFSFKKKSACPDPAPLSQTGIEMVVYSPLFRLIGVIQKYIVAKELHKSRRIRFQRNKFASGNPLREFPPFDSSKREQRHPASKRQQDSSARRKRNCNTPPHLFTSRWNSREASHGVAPPSRAAGTAVRQATASPRHHEPLEQP